MSLTLRCQSVLDAVAKDLNITQVPTLRFKEMLCGTMGIFDYNHSQLIVNPLMEQLGMEVHGITFETTIAHEMRHCWQIQTGILRIRSFGVIYDGVYHGDPVSLPTNKEEYQAYLRLPWEVDARNYEDKWRNHAK